MQAAGKGSADGAPGRQGARSAIESEQLLSAFEVTRAVDAAEDLRLLQCYEPVLRFTRGELFLPMAVEDYLEKCSLWRSASGRPSWGRRRPGERVCAPGELTPARLAQASAPLGGNPPGGSLSLRFVQRSLGWREFRAWRRAAGRPRLAAGNSRLAAVGLLGRLIDAVLRLSLLLRGRVPGGTAAAAEQTYRSLADPDSCPYYGRVTRDRGFIALQYWFFYAMNDWRSTFGGVNDHEADWEQVTVFLPDPPDHSARPAWVAFSSHDETGDDLRRRSDDPDLQWRDTHPVVFAGAGSIRAPACQATTWLRGAARAPSAVRRTAPAGPAAAAVDTYKTDTAFGIPFIDYRRGEGPAWGPAKRRDGARFSARPDPLAA